MAEDDVTEHLRDHLTDGWWHDRCRYCLRRRVHGGTGVATDDRGYGEWTDDEWRQAARETSVRDDREGVDEQEARHSRELSEMRERWYEAADDRNEP